MKAKEGDTLFDRYMERLTRDKSVYKLTSKCHACKCQSKDSWGGAARCFPEGWKG